MKRLIGVFLLYFLVFVIYLFLLGSDSNTCAEWNEITTMFTLILHISAIFLTVLVTRDEFDSINTRFLARLSSSLVYLVIFYILTQGQVLMLKCIWGEINEF